MFYVEKILLHEALFGLSSESTSAHISTHSTTYSDGGRALRAAAGSRAAVTAIGGDRHTKATRLRGTALADSARPRTDGDRTGDRHMLPHSPQRTQSDVSTTFPVRRSRTVPRNFRACVRVAVRTKRVLLIRKKKNKNLLPIVI